MADAALELEQRVERRRRQRPQLGPLGGKRLGDDLLRGAVYARVGDSCEPVIQLGVEIVEIAEAAREEEVLPDVAERTLDLALGLGAVRPARARMEAVMLCERQQRPVTCALSFSRIARRSLALQPAHSRCHQFVTR